MRNQTVTGDKEIIQRVCIGNHVISNAVWDKSAQLNYSKTNQICGL